MDIQKLLDEEARLSNQGRNAECEEVRAKIRKLTEHMRKPPCFGEDDCSTMMLLQCPFRFDCGK